MTYEKPSIWEITRGFVIGLLWAVGVVLIGLIIQRTLSLETVERVYQPETCRVPYRCDRTLRKPVRLQATTSGEYLQYGWGGVR